MGILDIFRRRRESDKRRTVMGQTISLDSLEDSPQLAEWMRTGGAMTAAGVPVTADGALKVSAVYRCVDLISGAVAGIPIDVYRRKGENVREEADDHYLWELLKRRPNRWQTPFEFKRQIMMHLLLRGNAYAIVVRSRGAVTELIPIHPDRVTVEQGDDHSIRYTWTRRDGRRVALSSGDVMHVRGMSLDGVTGLSPIAYAREAIGLAAQAETFGASLFRNGTSLAAVLKHPQSLSDDAIDRIRRGLEEFRGASQAFRTIILEEGMDLTPIGMTSEDAQFIQLRQFQSADIYRFFGVPPHMAGDTEKVTSWGAGIEQMSIAFVTYTLASWLTAIEQAIVRDLIPIHERDIYVRCNTRALLRGDMKSRSDAYKDALQWGWMCPDEVRALEDMNPRPDGKGGVFYEPPNAPGGAAQREESDEPEASS